jgi:hypothetical protein
MKNAYLNNLQIHDNVALIGFYLKPNIQGLEMPDIRLPSFERPNIDGAFVPNQLYGGRPITLEGKVIGPDILTYRTRRKSLEDVARIYRPVGALSPVTLKFKTMDDLELQVEVFTKKLKFAEKWLTAADYVLDLYAPNIRILSQELHQTQVNIFEGGGMGIPMPIPMDLAVGGSVETTVNNAGGISSLPFFIIYGTIDDPTISNQTTGDSFSLNYTLTSAAERIEIDVENRTVLYYATANAAPVNIRQYFSGDWLELAAGNNVIKLVVADTSDTGYMFVKWRDAYIGV